MTLYNINKFKDVLEVTLYKKIDELFENLSPSQKKIAVYLKKNWEQVCLMTAKELGEKVKVSEATVHRVAQQLGYESFLHMKKDLKENYLNERALVKIKQKEKEDNNSQWMKNHFIGEVNIIKKTYELNKEENFMKATEIIVNSNKLWVAGWKLGNTITSNISFSLNYMFGNCHMIENSEIAEELSHMNKGDTLIVSGFQRYCSKTLKIIEMSKQKELKTIVFTDCSLSPFTKYADVSFYAATDSSYFLDSYVGALALVNALMNRICVSYSEKIENNIKNIEQFYKIFKEY